ncbi:hypothetical protein ILUMI_10775 [Ignelater luminosus]|uniref:RNase H type-1 domain-containing protein n=1 Tax=Ignelater luminosus TaxID=2038154 RepID=A0A8K0CX98_IGNLU|nr:hypothetical protein ILUMI_10775 [Ignelater luminosus]
MEGWFEQMRTIEKGDEETVHAQAYVDDQLLLIGAKSARKLEKLWRATVEKCEQWATTHKLEYNVEKTQSLWGLSEGALRKVYLAGIRPMFIYAAEIWESRALDSRLQRQLNALQRSYLLAISRCYRTTSTAALKILTTTRLLWLEARTIYEFAVKINTGTFDKKVKLTELPHPGERGNVQFHRAELGTSGEGRTTSVYTDGPKLDGGVGTAMVVYKNDQEILNTTGTLNAEASVYQAEYDIKNKIALEVYVKLQEMINIGHTIELYWIRAHVSHLGNERVDALEKENNDNSQGLT